MNNGGATCIPGTECKEWGQFQSAGGSCNSVDGASAHFCNAPCDWLLFLSQTIHDEDVLWRRIRGRGRGGVSRGCEHQTCRPVDGQTVLYSHFHVYRMSGSNNRSYCTVVQVFVALSPSELTRAIIFSASLLWSSFLHFFCCCLPKHFVKIIHTHMENIRKKQQKNNRT